MKKTAALLLAACLLAMLPLRAQSTAGKDDKPVKFKDFTVTEAPGQVKKLSDYAGKGKYLLVDFWASWCGPCRRAVPVIKDLYKQYRGDKFEVLSVAVSDDPEDTKRAQVEKMMLWPQIINAQQIPIKVYGFQYIPYMILIGPDGTLLEENIQVAELAAVLKKYLGAAPKGTTPKK